MTCGPQNHPEETWLLDIPGRVFAGCPLGPAPPWFSDANSGHPEQAEPICQAPLTFPTMVETHTFCSSPWAHCCDLGPVAHTLWAWFKTEDCPGPDRTQPSASLALQSELRPGSALINQVGSQTPTMHLSPQHAPLHQLLPSAWEGFLPSVPLNTHRAPCSCRLSCPGTRA